MNLRGGSFSPVAALNNSIAANAIYTSPTPDILTKKKPKGNVYNVHLFGQECDCTGGRDSENRCLQGGAKASFTQFIDRELCAAQPDLPQCGTQKAFQSMADVKLPRAKELGAVSGSLCNSFRSLSTDPLKNIGGLGTTTTKSEIKNSEIPTPYGVEGLGTVTAAKECISSVTSFPMPLLGD
jgi:hypothetical protein